MRPEPEQLEPAPCRRAICRPLLLALVLVGAAAGCRTAPTLPAINLREPAWTVHSGQAIWRRKRGGEGIAGEIIVGTTLDGRAFVQFSKSPFALVVAQSTPKAWSVEFPPQNKHYSGRGRPPRRIIFLQLPRVLSGLPPPDDWTWQRQSDGSWRLENPKSGESLDVYLNP